LTHASNGFYREPPPRQRTVVPVMKQAQGIGDSFRQTRLSRSIEATKRAPGGDPERAELPRG
jgi:hypothetical protein